MMKKMYKRCTERKKQIKRKRWRERRENKKREKETERNKCKSFSVSYISSNTEHKKPFYIRERERERRIFR